MKKLFATMIVLATLATLTGTAQACRQWAFYGNRAVCVVP